MLESQSFFTVKSRPRGKVKIPGSVNAASTLKVPRTDNAESLKSILIVFVVVSNVEDKKLISTPLLLSLKVGDPQILRGDPL